MTKSTSSVQSLPIVLFLVALLFCPTDSFAQLNERKLDTFVESVMKQFEVPGVSVSIVKDGQSVLAKGYGTKSIETGEPVDRHTLFGIASNTKAFTATALGILQEEGKLEWDNPVIDYLPSFRMSDPYVTAEMTVRDLLVHRSGLGLGAGDLMWWPPSDYDRKAIVHRLRFVPLKTSFRSAYAYDNVLYSVAGEVIEALSGQTWEEFVQTRILDRLGMTESNVLHSAAGHGANVAAPHAPVNGTLKQIAPFASDNTNPAGGINANAIDIAKWMTVQLDSGRVAVGDRLFSRATTKELWTIVTPKPISEPPDYLKATRTNFFGYGLGFNVQDYRGIKMVTHTGGLPGYVSRIAMIPELKLGVAVFTNQESGDAFNAIVNHILDLYLGASDTDWLAAYALAAANNAASAARIEAESVSARNADSVPSLMPSGYAGTYRDAWYGDVDVQFQDGQLRMMFSHTPSLVGTLEHWQYDTFLVRWDDRELRADAFVTFSLGTDGKVELAKMAAASPLVDFSFDFEDLVLKPVR
ncbi:serine hydrolase [bacterium]|nr:serine hydrolase [bacterium]